MKDRHYVIEALSLNQDAGAVESNCADITFTNFGTATLTIDDVIPLGTNMQRVITGNEGEINVTRHRYVWSGGGTRIGTVERKLFVS